MFSDFEMFWGTCFLYFNACQEKWNVTAKEMGEIIYKYKLASLIEKSGDFLDSHGIPGVVNIIEKYIKRVDTINEKV